MANKAYRSIATGNWSNSGNTVWQVYSLDYVSGNSFPSGGAWSSAGANVYPSADDFVWIQSTNIVTFDLGTSITSFKQISRQTAAHIGYAGTVAQPATGGTDASTGYILVPATATSTIRSIYYIIGTGLSSTTAFFTITGSNVTLNCGLSSGASYFCEGTGVCKIIDVNSLQSNISITLTTTATLKAAGSNPNINLTSASTFTLTCSSIDLTSSNVSFISTSSTASTININGDLYGSNVSSGPGCIAGTGSPIININGNLYAGTFGACIFYNVTFSGYVQVSGIVRNHGISGSTPNGNVNAIVGLQTRALSSASFYFNISGTSAGFSTSATPGAADIWNYLTSSATTAGSLGKLIVDNLNATVGSRATQTSVDTAQTDITTIKTSTNRIPTNPASIESTGGQIASLT